MLDTSKLMKLQIAIDPISNKGFKELIKIPMPKLRAISLVNTNLTNDMLNIMTKRQFNIFHIIEFSYQCRIDGNRFLKNVLRLTDKRVIKRVFIEV